MVWGLGWGWLRLGGWLWGCCRGVVNLEEGVGGMWMRGRGGGAVGRGLCSRRK